MDMPLQLVPGEFRATWPHENVLLLWSSGHVPADCVNKIEEALRLLPKGTRFHIFCDTVASETYDPKFRRGFMQVMKRERDAGRLLSVQFIVQSKIIKMGIAVANVFLGGLLQTRDSRLDFEVALRIAAKQK